MRLSHIVVAALATASLLFAEEAAAPAAAPAKEKAPKAAAAKVAAKKISGTLASIDLVGNTIVVNVKKAQETIAVDSTTKVKVSGKKAALADLKQDMQVKVSYKEEEGKKVAVEISEKGAVASAKKAEKAAEPAPEQK